MSQLPLDFNIKACYRVEDFIKSPSNSIAFEILQAWPAWPSYGLILYGAPKVGKTHLAHLFEKKSRGMFLEETHLLNLESFEHLIHPGQVYILDRWPTFKHKIYEHPLFHLCNLVKERRAFLLILAETPPLSWGIQLPDLLSRLCVFPSIEISKPEDDLVEAIIMKKMSDLQIEVDESVFRYILTHTERSVEAILNLLDHLNQASLIQKRKITVPLVKEVLSEIFV